MTFVLKMCNKIYSLVYSWYLKIGLQTTWDATIFLYIKSWSWDSLEEKADSRRVVVCRQVLSFWCRLAITNIVLGSGVAGYSPMRLCRVPADWSSSPSGTYSAGSILLGNILYSLSRLLPCKWNYNTKYVHVYRTQANTTWMKVKWFSASQRVNACSEILAI